MSITVIEGSDTTKTTSIYYFDRVRINVKLPLELLKTYFPENKYGRQLSLRKPYAIARYHGYKSRIELLDPSAELILEISKVLAGIQVSISYIEITKDIICQSKFEASIKTKTLIETARKKHSPLPFIYDQKKSKAKGRINNDPALFSDKIGYFGSKRFKYVPYARLSKINNLPCIHAEWRITRAAVIKKKTGIKSIQDLATFDLVKYFEDTTARYIVHEAIDINKLGKWLTGLSRRKKFTKRQRMSIQLAAVHQLRTYDIDSHTDLVSLFIQQKAQIKNHRGQKNEYQRKVLAIKDYGKFRTPITIPNFSPLSSL